MDDMEHLSKPSEDVSEVIFSQPEERAGATGRMAQYWTDGRKMLTAEVDRSVDDVLMC